MKSFCYRMVTVAGLGLFSSGCAVDALEDELPTAPRLSAMDGPDGRIYMNGLHPRVYQTTRGALDQLMNTALPHQGMAGVNPHFDALLDINEGSKVLNYAIECALPALQEYGDFTGAGIMTTTSSWLSGPLNPQQRNDLHTCITTRLNPHSEPVPIWGGGPNTAKSSSSDDYEYSEAVWSVTVGELGVSVSVWPSNTFQLKGNCGSTDIEWDFNTRICDNDPSLCGITLRTDFDTACVGERGEGNIICDGKPAIETKLNRNEWNIVHSEVCSID